MCEQYASGYGEQRGRRCGDAKTMINCSLEREPGGPARRAGVSAAAYRARAREQTVTRPRRR